MNDNQLKLRGFIDKLIAEFSKGLFEAVAPVFGRRYGDDWKTKIAELMPPSDFPYTADKFSLDDPLTVFKLVESQWDSGLNKKEWGRHIRIHVRHFKKLRNLWAHHDPISERQLFDALGRAKLTLRELGLNQRRESVERLEAEILEAKRAAEGMLFPDGEVVTNEVINTFEQREETDSKKGKETPSSVWNRLNRRQRMLVNERTKTGYRRIRGSAGSGKTIVIAARAVQCAFEGKQVLVVAFNKTMINYIWDLIRYCALETYDEQLLRNITCRHFHGWCKEVLKHFKVQPPTPPKGESDADAWHAYNRRLAEVTQSSIEDNRQGNFEPYDAILVDEGQDFYLEWWQALRSSLVEGEDVDGYQKGEMMLVADATQDLYGTASAWTDEAMNGAGFKGPWAELEVSYRLPPALIPLVSIFVDEHLPHSSTNNRPIRSDAPLDKYPFAWKWHNIDDYITSMAQLVKEVGRMAEESCGRKIVVQVPSRFGRDVIKSLDNQGIPARHIFDRFGQNTKECFALEPGIPAVVTAHSFKGFEAPLVVAWLDDFRRPDKKNAAYVALTRVQRCEAGSELVVFNHATEIAKVPQDWEKMGTGYSSAGADFF